MALQTVPPLNPNDALVNHGIDFSDLVAPDGSLSQLVDVTASPDTMGVQVGYIGDGKRPGCVAQFKLTPGAEGNFIVTASVVDSAGESLSRSIIVPVIGV